jgi:hypothetical protein
MYQFNDEFNHKSFFWFRKKLVADMNWAILSRPAKAIFPVISCYADKNGIAWPGERTIAILSGYSDKAVRQGIRELEGFSGFKWSPYTTKRGKRSKKFNVKLPQENNKDCFPFHQYLLESGMWRCMQPTSKALYVTMRAYSYFDYDEYFDELDEAYPPDEDFNEEFANRLFDFCDADRGVLIKHSGISRRSLYTALNDITTNFLIEQLEHNRWKVFLKPTNPDGGYMIKTRSYLNKQLCKKYRS